MTPSQRTNANQQTTNAMHSTSRWRTALVRQGLMNDQRKPTRSGELTRAQARARAHACNANRRVGSRGCALARRRVACPAWPKKPAEARGNSHESHRVYCVRRSDCRPACAGSEATGRALLRRWPTDAAGAYRGLRPRRHYGPRRRFCAFWGQEARRSGPAACA